MHTFLRQAKRSFAFQQGAREIIRNCNPFLCKMGINNFYYVRITRKGELLYLTNQVDYALEYWEANLPLRTGFAHAPEKIQNSFLIWENQLDQEILNFVKTKKCYDGFSFIHRSYNVVQFASFLCMEPLKNPSQFYLNNYSILSCWLKDFELKQRELIKHAEQYPMQLPEKYLTPQKDSFYPKRTIELSCQQITSAISFREMDCLHYFTKGFTCPYIAHLLGLSSRTVETYLDTIKNKFGLSSRNELALLAYGNPIVHSYSPS